MAGVRELKRKDDMIDHSKDWTNTGSFVNKPSKGWLHPNEQLHPGAGVCYRVRYVGCMEVLESMKSLNFETRTQIAKESINMVAESAGLKLKQSKKSSKIRALIGCEPLSMFTNCDVLVTITTAAIDIVAETGEAIAHHEMPGISFASGGEEETQDFVAYVAKDDTQRRACHVLECGQQLAQDVITTIGQAFELRFKMFLSEQQRIGRNVMRVEPAQFEKNSNNWGNDDEYYNDRPGARPPSPSMHDSRPSPSPTPPHPDYSIPPNNSSVKGGTAVYSSVRPQQRDSNLIDFSSDTNTLTNGNGVTRPDENYDTPRPAVLAGEGRHDDSLRPMNNGQNGTTRSYQNVTISQPPPQALPPPLQAYPKMAPVVSSSSTPPPAAAPAPPRSQPFTAPVARPQPVPVSVPLVPPAPAVVMATQFPPPPQHLLPHHVPQPVVQPHHPPQPMAAQHYPTQPMVSHHPPQTVVTHLSLANEQVSPSPTPGNAFDLAPVCRTLPRGAPQVPAPMPDIQVLPYNEPWFHGKISRQKCEELLREPGQFLVRESANSPGQFVLSGCQNGMVRHLLLVDPNGVVRTKDRTFSSIAHLIDFHVNNRLPISSNDTELELRVPLHVSRPLK